MKAWSYIRRRNFVLTGVVVFFSLILSGFAWSFKTVNILVDGRQINVHTLANSSEEIIRQAGFELQPGDEFYVNGNILANGTSIEISRAMPVILTCKGSLQTVMTGKRTVKEVLEAEGISQAGNRIVPEVDTKVTAGLTIKVIAVKEENIDTEELIPYPVVREPDSEAEYGTERIISQGTNGIKKVSTKVRYEDGSKVSSTVIDEKVISEAKPHVVRTGTRDTVQTSRGSVNFRNSLTMRASAYTPYDGSQTGTTATGIKARNGIVAVDTKVIPLGTKVYIPNYGFALAADTGGDIVGNRIDLCMESYNAAMQFGRRTIKVYILN